MHCVEFMQLFDEVVHLMLPTKKQRICILYIQGRWKQLRIGGVALRVRKFLLINIHEEGVSTLLRELKWLFLWSLQSLFAAVHSVFTVSSKVLQLYL